MKKKILVIFLSAIMFVSSVTVYAEDLLKSEEPMEKTLEESTEEPEEKPLKENMVEVVDESSEEVATESVPYAADNKTATQAIQWVKSKEGQSIDADGVYGAQCVDLILAYYDYLGVPRSSGNGSDYTWNKLPTGWSRIQNAAPKPGDILVYTGGYNNYGHVAIYESDYSTYHQRFNSHSYVERVTYKYNSFSSTPYWGVIRPNFSNKWYDSLTPANLGNDFYSALIKNEGWMVLGGKNNNVELCDDVADVLSEIWHFVRQSDGSYVIYNCANNQVLHAGFPEDGNGTNVELVKYSGGDNQKWYIYGRWSGEWIFRPKYSDRVLDVKENSNVAGTNVQLWDYYNSGAQKFATYMYEKAESSTISVKTGNSVSKTTFSWTEGSSATKYNLRIKRGAPGNVATYKDVWNLTTTSYSIVLPAGYYEVYVDSANSFSSSTSNTLKFDLEQYIPEPVKNLKAGSTGKNKVSLSWSKSPYAKGYLIYAQKNGKYGYCGMTSETTFIDKNALSSDYNYYWVFPYTENTSGKMFPGGCTKYVYAKGVCPAVTNLKASSVKGGIRLTWSKVQDAQGYLIYGIRGNGKYGYVGKTSENAFIDKKALKASYNFYWVYPYHKESNGKMIVGGVAPYTYGKAK